VHVLKALADVNKEGDLLAFCSFEAIFHVRLNLGNLLDVVREATLGGEFKQ